MKRYKVTIGLAVISAILWVTAFYERGRFDMDGYHPIYEPTLLNVLFVINAPAELFAVLFLGLLQAAGLPVDLQGEGVKGALTLIVVSSIQWGLIGYLTDRHLNKARTVVHLR